MDGAILSPEPGDPGIVKKSAAVVHRSEINPVPGGKGMEFS
jgi:hypothetical protein